MITPGRWATGLTASVLGLLALASLPASSSGNDALSTQSKQFEAYWTDLEKDETAATRALLKLADHPKEAVSFLKTKLKPLKISSGEVKALLLKLGSENEALWKPAFEELDYFDPRLAIDLQTLMDRYTEIPVRRRLVEILSGYAPDTLKEREDIQIRSVGTGFNFSAKTARGPRVVVGRASRRTDQLGWFPGQSQEEVDPRRSRHRAAGAHSHARCRRDPQRHGRRPSRSISHQGCPGSLGSAWREAGSNQPDARS